MNILQPYYTGLIPAYAGKTFIRVFACGSLWAHPRVCGENVVGA